jgi:hypothetical protein
MDPSADQDSRLLADLRRRRAELRESMNALEHALASPVGRDLAHWAELVRTAAAELSSDFREHVEITEGPDGLYRELEQHAPRLAGPVGRLSCEHDDVARQLEDMLSLMEGAELPDADDVRRSGTKLLAALMHHRQRGADLVFEAYDTDIGGET